MTTVTRWLPLPAWPVVAALGFTLAGIAVGYQTTNGPSLVLAAGLGVAIAAVAFLSLPVGLVLLTFLLFFELIPGFGAGNLTLVKVVGLLIAVSWLARVIDIRSGIRLLFVEHRLFSLSIVAFFVWAAASAVWAVEPGEATATAIRLLLVIVLTFVTYSAVHEPKHLYWVLWTFCTGAALTTTYGLVSGLAVGRDDRLVGGILNPNELAGALVPAVILGVFLFGATRGSAARALLAVEIATCMVGLLLTQSRGAFVGLAVALVFSIFVAGPARPAAIALALIVSAAAFGYYTGFTTPEQRDRLVNVSASGSSGRSDEWHIALRVAGDHPLKGVGLANFQSVEPQYLARTINLIRADRVLYFPPPHNVYLQVLSELGVIGLALFLLVLGGAVVIGLRSVAALARGPDRALEIVARGLVIGFVSVLALNVFNNGLVEKGLWLFVGLICATASFVPHRDEAHDTVVAGDGDALPA